MDYINLDFNKAARECGLKGGFFAKRDLLTLEEMDKFILGLPESVGDLKLAFTKSTDLVFFGDAITFIIRENPFKAENKRPLTQDVWDTYIHEAYSVRAKLFYDEPYDPALDVGQAEAEEPKRGIIPAEELCY